MKEGPAIVCSCFRVTSKRVIARIANKASLKRYPSPWLIIIDLEFHRFFSLPFLVKLSCCWLDCRNEHVVALPSDRRDCRPSLLTPRFSRLNSSFLTKSAQGGVKAGRPCHFAAPRILTGRIKPPLHPRRLVLRSCPWSNLRK